MFSIETGPCLVVYERMIDRRNYMHLYSKICKFFWPEITPERRLDKMSGFERDIWNTLKGLKGPVMKTIVITSDSGSIVIHCSPA